MKQERIMKALTIIVEAQKTCSSVTVKVGTTVGNRVLKDCLVITDCPSVMVSKLISEGYSLSMHEGEMHIDWLSTDKHNEVINGNEKSQWI